MGTNRIFNILLVFTLAFTLSSCKDETVVQDEPLEYNVIQTENDQCNFVDAEYTNDQIDIVNVTAENSSMFGDVSKFISPCKNKDENPLVFAEGTLKSHKVTIELDAIYPVNKISFTNFISDESIALKSIDIAVSLDGEDFTKIEDDFVLLNTGDKTNQLILEDMMMKYIKISFSSESGTGNNGSDFFGLNDIRFYLGEGFIVKDAEEWTDSLLRHDGWTGADGIFSYNLTNGNDGIGNATDSTLFIFSDTFIGGINTETMRREHAEMVNNTIGYYDGSDDISDGFSFVWNTDENDLPTALFPPDSFIGYQASNIINNIGLSDYNNYLATYDYTVGGSSWKTASDDENPELVFDFMSEEDLSKMYLYNFVEDLELATTNIKVYHSNDKANWSLISQSEVSVPAQTNAISTSLIGDNEYLDLSGITARYIKIEIIDNNSDETSQVGLSKLLFYGNTQKLYAKVTASSYDPTIEGNELTSRLWLQDGVVIGDYFYDMPILVKNYSTYFKVFKVGMIKIHIVDGRLDLDSTEYIDTPLQTEMDEGSVTFYGCGVMNLDTSGGMVNQDGYIYVYGYKDFEGRYLTVARVEEENFENFNKWEYFDGTSWNSDVRQTGTMINGVSPELSVTYIDEGNYAGKYMLTVMENTSSGIISISFSDNPYGPFDEYSQVYNTAVVTKLNNVFSYNAKMHPHLSEPGKILVSFNVNSTDFSAFTNGDIYRPRFIWLIETKER